jgi:hypothetical protein
MLCFSAVKADFLASTKGSGIGSLRFLQADDPPGALHNKSGLDYAEGLHSPLMSESYQSLYSLEPPEIFNPPPDSDIKPPVIDKDTIFKGRRYLRYDVEIDVADISSKGFKRIVFYLRPKVIIKTNSWKLYIFKAKIKTWDNEEIDRWALKVIEGSGLPPINVVWNGKSRDGKLLPAGKYYCILTARDTEGQNFITKWHRFKLE